MAKDKMSFKEYVKSFFTRNFLIAIGGLHQTVLRSKTDAMRSERTKLIQL